ncbi:hypothetical protein BATDEDRAFT_87319 [Batrachochytrium dendrobatidis JAM81]|uniref:Uncharacterized protein n=1 Tax=Batrachochytrium dendrobatidis (strain JAM81 / FGSC 10211) TaxID=684364 RepID=F4NY68_BATDJ|nr:uncharacterized protein BATDEDRAFT_87319 [Batrachochytrium dendrobatidis JAM81]EGF81964.1 hypothetical protein BATDEDRAFT_87319 [Batrachochytrium dendrobatidis JAM81]|eukprot:XP_006677587.1 hypothetical protein BATDEDRAFT_87319 [Batrachochytrium dendrobatidis JAM81]
MRPLGYILICFFVGTALAGDTHDESHHTTLVEAVSSTTSTMNQQLQPTTSSNPDELQETPEGFLEFLTRCSQEWTNLSTSWLRTRNMLANALFEFRLSKLQATGDDIKYVDTQLEVVTSKLTTSNIQLFNIDVEKSKVVVTIEKFQQAMRNQDWGTVDQMIRAKDSAEAYNCYKDWGTLLSD